MGDRLEKYPGSRAGAHLATARNTWNFLHKTQFKTLETTLFKGPAVAVV